MSRQRKQAKKETKKQKRKRASPRLELIKHLHRKRIQKKVQPKTTPPVNPAIPFFSPSFSAQGRRELPSGYGDNQIYLLVRDPYWLHTYWEIQEWHFQRGLADLGRDRRRVKLILRVYDTTDKTAPNPHFDIGIGGFSGNWYIEVGPNRSFVVEIGLLHDDGRFIALARSNEQRTPRDGMSEVIDEEWMGIDFEKVYALSGGFEAGRSSLELRELMRKRMEGAISSGSGVSQISSIGISPVKIKTSTVILRPKAEESRF